jgi:hypothetical protein
MIKNPAGEKTTAKRFAQDKMIRLIRTATCVCEGASPAEQEEINYQMEHLGARLAKLCGTAL